MDQIVGHAVIFPGFTNTNPLGDFVEPGLGFNKVDIKYVFLICENRGPRSFTCIKVFHFL